MGYRVNTTYLNHPSVSAVVAALEKTFATEGMQRIALPERGRLAVEPMQYDTALNNDVWGVAVFPGADQWTVIHTAPLELLAEPIPASGQRRIVALCKELQCSALMVNVYDSTGTIIAECDSHGEQFVCGYNGQSGRSDPYRDYIENAIEQSFRLRLRVHSWLGLTLEEGDWGQKVADMLAQHCAGANAKYCDNILSVDTLICRKPLNISAGEALHFKWIGPSRQRFQPSATFESAR
jgi:hypothetical protein